MIRNGLVIQKALVDSLRVIPPSGQDQILGCAFRRAFGLDGPHAIDAGDDPFGAANGIVDAIVTSAEAADNRMEVKREKERERKAKSKDSATTTEGRGRTRKDAERRGRTRKDAT